MRQQPAQLSAKDLDLRPKKKPLRVQVSKTPKNSVKIHSKSIPTHRTWALILTLSCFFLIGPIWALYKSSEIRRLIAAKELERAEKLSNRISVMLITCSIIGGIVWLGILFSSVGLLLTGKLLTLNFI